MTASLCLFCICAQLVVGVCFIHMGGWQTFAVLSVEERHVNDSGLLLFPLKHVAVLRPVSVLQDLFVYCRERLPHCGSIVSGKSQGLGGGGWVGKDIIAYMN